MHVLEAALAAFARHKSVHRGSGDDRARNRERWTLASLVARWRVSASKDR
jgi:hypothetical protein